MPFPRIRISVKTKTRAVKLGWIALAFYLFKKFEIWDNLVNEPIITQSFFYIPAIISTIIVISVYLYIKFIKRVKLNLKADNQGAEGKFEVDSWETTAKSEIQLATVFGLLSFLFWTFSCWLIWGFLTPVLMIVETIGALSILSFI
ncbi:hypothetical protein CONCODRAFT_80026 [Conidiobolus coronatus NRRL 28638]|uniref:Uncharacterized protein n=1 Tax=Conidiobolus coronatus (strain ATCC 28846 / CBS 209.66 / NRRL 28638) TaxID=796925 RepID=A0A137NY25_CONC2|nr:hypothetical protein CONCODRAFT_80026 [Conidiobolus coronatus NRRL 28638]|eukprot:KXN67695.1 hypothetical protein CONCODRAFT_80026 [Conidiobolus coronatus NRRL 28638]